MLAEHLALRGLSALDAKELLFVRPRGGRLDYSNWHEREWAPTLSAAGLTNFRFHGLRHTSVALMVELGTHVRVIQERLGHSSFATTMDIYGHILAPTDDGVTDRLDAMFRPGNGTTMAPPTGSRGQSAR